MKPMLRITYLFLFSLFFTACEKDIINIIPEEAKKKSEFQQDFKNVIVKNSSSAHRNGKVWVSNKLKYGDYYNYIFDGWEHPVEMNFFVAFEFMPDNTAKTYVTIRRDLQTKSDTSDLYDNINTYHVGGELRTELTFLSKGVLSGLKKQGATDFDYRISSFSDKEIKIKPYFTQTVNPEITLRPYDFNKFKTFAKASEILQGTTYKGRTIHGLWIGYYVTLTVTENSTKKLIGKIRRGNFWRSTNLFIQDYDKDRDLFLFRIFDSQDPEVLQARRKYTSLEFFHKNDVKYLVPISATDTKIEFETYGSDKANDKKYTVTMEVK